MDSATDVSKRPTAILSNPTKSTSVLPKRKTQVMSRRLTDVHDKSPL